MSFYTRPLAVKTNHRHCEISCHTAHFTITSINRFLPLNISKTTVLKFYRYIDEINLQGILTRDSVTLKKQCEMREIHMQKTVRNA